CEAVGLEGFVIELGQVGLVRRHLADIPEALHLDVLSALALKDRTTIATLLDTVAMSTASRAALLGFSSWYGDVSVVEDARAILQHPEDARLLDELAVVVDRLSALGFGDRLRIDLGETQGMRYYTGLNFRVLANGPGESIGGGGRYDN